MTQQNDLMSKIGKHWVSVLLVKQKQQYSKQGQVPCTCINVKQDERPS